MRRFFLFANKSASKLKHELFNDKRQFADIPLLSVKYLLSFTICQVFAALLFSLSLSSYALLTSTYITPMAR